MESHELAEIYRKMADEVEKATPRSVPEFERGFWGPLFPTANSTSQIFNPHYPNPELPVVLRVSKNPQCADARLYLEVAGHDNQGRPYTEAYLLEPGDMFREVNFGSRVIRSFEVRLLTGDLAFGDFIATR